MIPDDSEDPVFEAMVEKARAESAKPRPPIASPAAVGGGCCGGILLGPVLLYQLLINGETTGGGPLGYFILFLGTAIFWAVLGGVLGSVVSKWRRRK